MGEYIRLEKNENGHGWDDIVVNGVHVSIAHDDRGRVTMYVHSKDDNLDIKIADANVSKKTHRTPCKYTGETKWVTIKVDGSEGDQK